MNQRIEFFGGVRDALLPRIVAVSIGFHFLVILFFFLFNSIRWTKEIEVIPVFELVQVNAPQPPPPQVRPPPPEQLPKPTPPQPEPIPPKPVPKQELPPEPKPKEEPPPEQEQTPSVPEVKQSPPIEPLEESLDDDFKLDDMDLPTFNEESSLSPAGVVDMDPVLQAYLERLKQIIMQNFNPPTGMDLPKSTKTTVQFTVDRFGNLSGITLRKSSGNKTWDHLSMRAVQIAKAPGLPSNYRNEALTLNFNFTPN